MNRAGVALGPGLVRVFEAIRELLTGAARDDARSRHQAGVLIADVKRAPGKYGLHAVEQLARALDSNVHTLYRCASVAECWSRDQLEELLARTSSKGAALSWSHLVILAGISSPKRRAELVEQALRDGLSVRELTASVDMPKGNARGGAQVALDRLVRRTERWSQDATDLHNDLLAELGDASVDDLEPAELIERAIAAEEQLEGLVHEQLARLRAAHGRLVHKTLANEETTSQTRVNHPPD